MDIKDYIHLYINSEAKFRKWYCDTPPEQEPTWSKLTTKRFQLLNDLSILKVEYSLRRLEDMTEEDLLDMVIHFSKVDLTDCDFEFELEEDKWVNAIEKHGGRRVIASLVVLDGDYISLRMMDDEGDMSHFSPQADGFHYLLKQGFDLFGLIDNNLAIDSKTLNK